MSAANPVSPTGPSAEPSMEEILASIRRIIADDQSLPSHAMRGPGPQASGAAPAPAGPPASAPVHMLRPNPIMPSSPVPDQELASASAPAIKTPVESDAMPPSRFAKSILAPEPADVAPEPSVDDTALDRAALPDVAASSSLFSNATKQSVTSAFGMLAASRLAENSDELLSIARDMIRPMLKDWLDDNLPSMVERLVRAEIERVSRSGR